MSAEEVHDLDLALRALADGNRRSILRVIRSGSQPVGEIAEELGLSQQTTSHHLGVLRKSGLAVRTKQGTRHLFAVNTDGLTAVRAYLDDFLKRRASGHVLGSDAKQLEYDRQQSDHR